MSLNSTFQNLYTTYKARVITSVVLALVLVTALFTGTKTMFVLLLLLAVALSYEAIGLLYPQSRWFVRGPLILLLLGLVAAFLLALGYAPWLAVGLLIFFSLWWILQLKWLRSHSLEISSLGKISYAIAVVPGFITAWAMIYWLHGPWPLLLLLLIVACSDIGAYLGGRAFPHTRLIPRVSPGKTTSGLCFGFLAGWIPVLFFMAITRAEYPWLLTAFFFVLIGVGVIGDLCASKIKRIAQVKDSGTLLPGHGGVLDRFDSHTAAAPLFALFSMLPVF